MQAWVTPDFALALARVAVDEHEERPPVHVAAVPVLVQRRVNMHVMYADSLVCPNDDEFAELIVAKKLVRALEAQGFAKDFEHFVFKLA